MHTTLQARLFERLADLIPGLEGASEGCTFFAPPRSTGDIASYCGVSAREGHVLELELAHDELVGAEAVPAPCLTFRVDVDAKLADVLVVHDEQRYEVVVADSPWRTRSARQSTCTRSTGSR